MKFRTTQQPTQKLHILFSSLQVIDLAIENFLVTIEWE